MVGLTERVALVTGAGGGIGRGIAHRLAAVGAAVVVNDVNGEGAEAVVAEIVAAGGQAAVAVGSVSDEAQAEAAVAVASETFGSLDILVNNAGITRDGVLHKMTDEQWDIVHDVVLRGVFVMCRAAAPELRRRDAGFNRKVVNISSAAGVYGYAGTTNYSAAKAGVIGLTKALAREWARSGVNVNAIAPGMIANTKITAGKPTEMMDQIERAIPIGRPGEPEDVAALVHFLVSADSDYITGQVIELHGGLELLPL